MIGLQQSRQRKRFTSLNIRMCTKRRPLQAGRGTKSPDGPFVPWCKPRLAGHRVGDVRQGISFGPLSPPCQRMPGCCVHVPGRSTADRPIMAQVWQRLADERADSTGLQPIQPERPAMQQQQQTQPDDDKRNRLFRPSPWGWFRWVTAVSG